MDQDKVIDWKKYTSNQVRRNKYSVSSVTDTESFCQSIRQAYARGILLEVEKCQQFFYFEIHGRGSIVCEECLPACRYATCSIDQTIIISLHVHAVNLANCLYCNKRIKCSNLHKCASFPTVSKLFVTENQCISKINI